MIRLEYSTEYKGKIETLTFKLDPTYYGIGQYTDINDVRWDIHAVKWDGNKKIVWARVVDNLPIYRTDEFACFQGYSASWKPYFVKIEKEF